MIYSQTTFFPNNIEIERVKIPKNFEYKNHTHTNFHLCVVADGSFEEISSSKIFECKKQTARISKPSANHEIYFGSEGGECIVIQLNERFANLINRQLQFKEDSFFNSYSKHIYEFFEKDNINSLSPSSLEIHLRKLLASCLGNNENHEPDWLEEVKYIIDSNPSETFDSTKLAGTAGVHRVHLSRTFSKYTGCTLQEYIFLKKLEKAHSVLTEPDVNISYVAYESGFADHSHFNKIFKRYFNSIPSVYKSKVLSGTHVTNVQESFNPAA